MLATAYVLNLADSGGGSFRQAIIDANNHPGFDRIDFSGLSGSGVKTIQVLSALPPVLEPVVIDGATAPGYAGAPLVELKGDAAGLADGLVIAAGSVTVRGMIVNGFSGSGIVIQQGAGTALVGNWIGTNSTGNLAQPNGGSGVDVQAGVTYALIGETHDWLGLQDPPTTPTFATEANPHAISTADLNGDGRSDFATANFGGTVSVALNLGNGHFAPSVSYPTAGAITDGLALADLNQDGRIDIVTANRDTNDVSVLLNLGGGIFASPVKYFASIAPHSVNTADFDGDGDLDLAVVSRDSQDVSILQNDGSGVYSSPVHYTVGTFPFESTVADFNGDSRPDIAVDNAVSNTVSILLNQGGGVFAPKVDYPVGSGPHSVTSADFDGDGAPDLATADNFSGTVSILHNNGDGTFATAVSMSVPGAIDITPSDINGDGYLDLVTANGSDNSISVLLNNGVGGFLAASRWAASGGERAIATADFDQDGDADVAVTQFGEADVRVYPNLGSAFGGNRIAANQGDGIRLNGSYCVVAANAVGLDGLGNQGNGVLIGADARDNQIGLPSGGNVFVGNAAAGIAVNGSLSTGHTLRFNGFVGNLAGIDLGSDGATPNDPGDADTGPNQLQNRPVLSTAFPGTATRVIGVIDSLPAMVVTLDFYTSATIATVPGQGQRYLGSIRVTTDGTGHAAFDTTALASTTPSEVITATATDADGNTSEFSTAIALATANHAPTAGLTGPTLAVPGQPLTFPISASDPDTGDNASGFQYVATFGDGSQTQVITLAPGNGAGLALHHTFTRTGSFSLSLTATDSHGALSSPVVLTISVQTAVLSPDALHAGQSLLAIGGTTDDDIIKVKPGRECGEIKVVLRDDDHVLFFRHTFDPTIDRIAVYGQAGDDDIVVYSEIDIPTWLYGGEGDDRLKGGGGPSVQLGGEGSDLLVGATGRDLLIGGTGADRIHGDSGEDILISGTTAHDSTDEALAAILAEWTSSRNDASRVANLKGVGSGVRANGNVFLITEGPGATVIDDGEQDVLTGGSGLDWLLFNVDGDGEKKKKDKATDLSAAEFASDLDFINGP